MFRFLSLFAFVALFASAPAMLHAMAFLPPAEEAEEPSAEEIANWIAELDSDTYSVRQEASDALKAAGAPAVEALEEASQDESSVERSTRAIDILVNLHREELEEATKALNRLAEGDSIAKEIAIAATEEAAAPPAEQPGGFGGIQVGPGIVLGSAQIMMERTGPEGEAIRIQHSDGVCTINVSHEDWSILIITDAEGHIRVDVTEENEEGERETTTTEAESQAELLEDHPEVHDIYQRYNDRQPRMRFEIHPNSDQIPQGFTPTDEIPEEILEMLQEHLQNGIDDGTDDESEE